MLSRVHIDNFRCFVNFEYRPTRKVLLMGTNGSGKSSFLDAILFMRQLVVAGLSFNDASSPYNLILTQKTRWDTRERMTFELESELDGGKYIYRLVVEPWGDPVVPRVAEETVRLDGKPIFEFFTGEVHLFNDRFELKVKYPFDWHRSALGTIMDRKDNQRLSRFKHWFGNLYCFRINPFSMIPLADRETPYPNVDLSNIAAWYRHLVQADPKQNSLMLDSLRKCLDGFNFMQLELAGETARLLTVEFNNGKTSKFMFHELSDGQRCLICLYTILYFVLAKGSTVILDEPDNFITLREIQPWLTAIDDSIEEKRGQIVVISHHPEAINQWAPGNGVLFFREEGGQVRTREFHGDPDGNLSPSEFIARGWEK